MTPPNGWVSSGTGGGCTAFEKQIEGRFGDPYWLITDDDDAIEPTNPDARCCLGFYIDGSVRIQWHCSCLAEAVSIAEGATVI